MVISYYFNCLSYPLDDDEIWSRISAKRKEILGQSSLRLKSTLPRYMYKVRFDLPGSPAPLRARSDVGSENKGSEETSDECKGRLRSTEQARRKLSTIAKDISNQLNRYFKIRLIVFRVF